MKRTALFVLVALLLMSVTAATKTPTIGCAIYKFDDTFMTSVRNSILATAEGRAQVDMVDSQNSQAFQNDRVDMFITKGVDALAINPVDRLQLALSSRRLCRPILQLYPTFRTLEPHGKIVSAQQGFVRISRTVLYPNIGGRSVQVSAKHRRS
jgi:hypothetical protein